MCCAITSLTQVQKLSSTVLIDPHSVGLSDPVYGSIDKLGIRVQPPISEIRRIYQHGTLSSVKEVTNYCSPFFDSTVEGRKGKDSDAPMISNQSAEVISLKAAQRDLIRTHEEILALEKEIRSARLGK